MKPLFVSAGAETADWLDALSQALPGREVLAAPPAGDRPSPYLAVGNPPPGLLAGLNGLELILSLNAGVDRLLACPGLPPAVPIVRMAERGLTEGMVEWVLAQVLAWHRQLFAYDADQRAGLWRPRPEVLASERTAVVLGAGALGGPVARALAGVGLATRVWSRTHRDLAGVRSFAGPAALDEALAGADILVSVLPLTPQTAGLIDAAALAALAPGALVVNGGRGACLVEADLLAALASGQVSQAALDVFTVEPLPSGHPFWSHPGVRISPHVAAPTHARTAAAAIAETIAGHERGEAVGPLVDRVRGY